MSKRWTSGKRAAEMPPVAVSLLELRAVTGAVLAPKLGLGALETMGKEKAIR